MEKFNISCLNLAAGYHRYHTANEYVVVEEVENSFELGLKLHEVLGENYYVGTKKRPTELDRMIDKMLIMEDDEDEDDDIFFGFE